MAGDMAILIDDCLLKIFSYLSMDDMMQAKRVCKIWYQVSQQWFNQVQTLVYNKEDTGKGRLELYEKYYKRKVYEKDSIYGFNDLISILHSCGHHIKYYKAGFIGKEKNPNGKLEKFIFQWVPKLCKNIVDLHICGYDIYQPWNFEIMAAHWKKLEKFYIRYLHTQIDENFLQLLSNNEQLKTVTFYVTLDSQDLSNDKFFTYLPTTIKEIIIKNISSNYGEKLSYFISASKNFSSLQLLNLYNFVPLSDAAVAAIANINSLTDLTLYDVTYESCSTIDSIANLKGLKSLSLAMNRPLHEDNIINIVKSCIQLEALTLRTGNVLTNRGLAAIAQLKKLKCLNIDMVNITTGSIISSCDSLEVLRCFHWKINNSDAIKLLEKASNLRFLGIFLCLNLTKDVLEAANEIANRRKNYILCITGNCRVLLDIDGIDTPYFKCFMDDKKIPLELFPNDIKNYIKKKHDD